MSPHARAYANLKLAPQDIFKVKQPAIALKNANGEPISDALLEHTGTIIFASVYACICNLADLAIAGTITHANAFQNGTGQEESSQTLDLHPNNYHLISYLNILVGNSKKNKFDD